MLRIFSFLLLTSLAGLVPSDVYATIVAPADLVELTRSARVIVRGQVVSIDAQWAEGRRRVETLVTIAAGAYLKGDFGPRVTVRVPGGDLGRYRSVMPGAPRFAEGDTVILFLDGQAPAVPHLVGFNQGVFRVRRDPSSGGSVVMPAPLVASSGEAERVRRGDGSRQPPPLDDFERQVREIVAGRVPSGQDDNRRDKTTIRGPVRATVER